jgi:patatin-like phospholipase/acyl hydrolase
MSPYRILSLDGGGIRGLFTATLLGRLADERPSFLEGIDLVAGTSTGGILALGLGAGLSPHALADLYRENARRIFDDSLWDDLKDLGRAIGADYGNKRLKRLLEATFADLTLGDLRLRVLVPAFDLDAEASGTRLRSWKPKFFHNFPGEDSDRGERVVDVALRTSAAPTYFPSYQGFIDGGVVANNPSMAAVAQALDPRAAGRALADLRLLSLSTGRQEEYLRGKRHDWGWGQWARPLVALMVSGTMGVADFQCLQLLGTRYHRIDPVLARHVDLDDVGEDALGDLTLEARAVDLAPALAWLDSVGW